MYFWYWIQCCCQNNLSDYTGLTEVATLIFNIRSWKKNTVRIPMWSVQLSDSIPAIWTINAMSSPAVEYWIHLKVLFESHPRQFLSPFRGVRNTRTLKRGRIDKTIWAWHWGDCYAPQQLWDYATSISVIRAESLFRALIGVQSLVEYTSFKLRTYYDLREVVAFSIPN